MTDQPLVTLNATEAAIARKNGHEVYVFTGSIYYSTPNWNTPSVPVNASGLRPPEVPLGSQLAFFDDFTSTTMNPPWTGPYNGQNAQGATWKPQNVKFPGDSTCVLCSNYDPVNGLAANNFWVSGGMGAWLHPLPVGSSAYACVKIPVLHENIANLFIAVGQSVWIELDALELTPSLDVPEPRDYQITIHWGNPDQSETINISAKLPNGIDFTQWNVIGWQWTPETIDFTIRVDGVDEVVASFKNPSQPNDVSGLAGPNDVIVSIQSQTGDLGIPAERTDITAANPLTQIFDWVIAFEPKVA